jgi:integrase
MKRGNQGARPARVAMTDKWVRAELRKLHSGTPRLQFHYDAVVPGLNLLRTPTANLWGMTKRWPGKGKSSSWRSLGTVYAGEVRPGEQPLSSGALTLAEARAKARRWLDLLERGVDPAAEAKRQRREVERRITFAALRDEYIKRHWRNEKAALRKADEAERLLRKEFAEWDDRPADDITGDDVDAVITGIIDRGSVGQARNVFGYLRAMYTWAIGNRRYGIKTSPCDELSPKALFGEKSARDRWLRDDELRAVWHASQTIGLAEPIIKLLILTACRLNEIARLRWTEIGEREIIVPASRMKGKTDFLIPITPVIGAILDAVPRNGGEYVFSTGGGRVPMTIGSKLKTKLDDELPGMPAWTWHDLRRTARTNFSKLSIAEEVREALLAHVKKGIKKNYNLHDYAQEKRDALMKWENALLNIVEAPSTDNVVLLISASA